MIDFRCEICGGFRPNAKISVMTYDLSEKNNLPEGTMKRNVNYCNDSVGCIAGARIMKGQKLSDCSEYKGGGVMVLTVMEEQRSCETCDHSQMCDRKRIIVDAIQAHEEKVEMLTDSPWEAIYIGIANACKHSTNAAGTNDPNNQ